MASPDPSAAASSSRAVSDSDKSFRGSDASTAFASASAPAAPATPAPGAALPPPPPPPPIAPGIIVTAAPLPTDVLSGRGKSINSHPGNVTMRRLCNAVRRTYLDPTTTKSEKTAIAMEIVRTIRTSTDPPGRFLRKEGGGGKGKDSVWRDIGDLLACKKVGQAIREGGEDVRRDIRLEKRSQEMLMFHQAAVAAAAAAGAVAVEEEKKEEPESPRPAAAEQATSNAQDRHGAETRPPPRKQPSSEARAMELRQSAASVARTTRRSRTPVADAVISAVRSERGGSRSLALNEGQRQQPLPQPQRRWEGEFEARTCVARWTTLRLDSKSQSSSSGDGSERDPRLFVENTDGGEDNKDKDDDRRRRRRKVSKGSSSSSSSSASSSSPSSCASVSSSGVSDDSPTGKAAKPPAAEGDLLFSGSLLTSGGLGGDADAGLVDVLLKSLVYDAAAPPEADLLDFDRTAPAVDALLLEPHHFPALALGGEPRPWQHQSSTATGAGAKETRTSIAAEQQQKGLPIIDNDTGFDDFDGGANNNCNGGEGEGRALDYLLSALETTGLAEAAVFTEEEEERERERLTMEEKVDIVADLYGSVDVVYSNNEDVLGGRTGKKRGKVSRSSSSSYSSRFEQSPEDDEDSDDDDATKSTNPGKCGSSAVPPSLDDLLMPLTVQSRIVEMRYELEIISSGGGSGSGNGRNGGNSNGRAMKEARAKSPRNEAFGDDFLELFLRREGMDPKAAAERYAVYWEGRLRLFGPDKFHLPMTLRGALRDDLDALERCVFQVLEGPESRDTAGRTVLHCDFSRYDRDVCSRESMLRAIWYTLESTLEEDPSSAVRGLVLLGWFKHFNLEHYDAPLERGIIDLECLYLPLKFVALHACCIATPLARLIKPAFFGNFDKRHRFRFAAHDVDHAKLAAVLGGYGIAPGAIPPLVAGDDEGHRGGGERGGSNMPEKEKDGEEEGGAGRGVSGGGGGDLMIRRHLTWLRGRIARGK